MLKLHVMILEVIISESFRMLTLCPFRLGGRLYSFYASYTALHSISLKNNIDVFSSVIQ